MKKFLIAVAFFFHIINPKANVIEDLNPKANVTEDLFQTLDSINISESPLFDYTPTESLFKTTDPALSEGNLRIVNFYKRRIPNAVAKIPKDDEGERVFWKKGDVIRDFGIPYGIYSVVRLNKHRDGYFVKYVGKVLSNGRNVKIAELFAEIQEGDYIVKEKYDVFMPPITHNRGMIDIRSYSIGTVSAFLESFQDEKILFAGSRSFIGAKFKKYVGGHSTSVGANYIVKRDGAPIAKAIVVDADIDLATMYVYDSVKEVRAGDEFYVE
jgi:hypothetical protein